MSSMSREWQVAEPIPPGTSVVVFLGDDPSHATAGYRGTLLGVCHTTVAASARSPGLWRYRIHVPALGGELIIPASRFLVPHCRDGNPILVLPEDVARLEAAVEPCQLDFACPVCRDNNELYGKFRFGLCHRGLFHFRKVDQPHPTYRLRFPVRGKHEGRAKLSYYVPAYVVLDQLYVVHSLVMILGCATPDDSAVSVSLD